MHRKRHRSILLLTPEQKGRHFTGDLFKRFFLNINHIISIVPRVPIDHKSAFIQVMTWCRKDDKPLPEPMQTHICGTRGEWVNVLIWAMSVEMRCLHGRPLTYHWCKFDVNSTKCNQCSQLFERLETSEDHGVYYLSNFLGYTKFYCSKFYVGSGKVSSYRRHTNFQYMYCQYEHQCRSWIKTAV